ncbi:MAG: amino acid ABC transporter permease [Alphaproteobacteria bacterium]|nr:amino acid ABC transporter permease [Alphaproteobacteria bacterium]
MTNWQAFLFTFFDAKTMATYAPKIAQGFLLTVELAILIVISGLALGLFLAVVRSFRIRPLNWLIVFAVDLFRALPPLVIIVFFYFGLPVVGLGFEGFTTTWLALTLVLAAFAEEIFWAGILAVPKGQWEAARSTGLGFLGTLGWVVLPQAIRMTIPPLTNRTIAITKGTALGSVVAVAEILSTAQSAMAESANPSPLTLGAIAYIILFVPVVIAGRWIETRFAWKR